SFLTLREGIKLVDGQLQLSDLTDAEKAHVSGNPGPGQVNLFNFSINGGGAQTILLESELPGIDNPVFLDGASQPGFADRPLITLSGANAGPTANGLVINAGGSTVLALRISGFTRDGIHLEDGGGNIIVGNVIGTDAPDHPELANDDGIILINSANNK